MPNHLWGEAIRHATYLINRVATRSLDRKTPYEALKGRKPNLSHLKVFGCVCYARTETAGRRKHDDRSRVLVHLETEPGSKAYRLVDPPSKRIVVNRDVIFEENKKWKWNDNKGSDGFVDGDYEINLYNIFLKKKNCFALQQPSATANASWNQFLNFRSLEWFKRFMEFFCDCCKTSTTATKRKSCICGW